MDIRGHLDLLLLSVLDNAGPVHGYAVIAALRDSSAGTFDLPEGTVYPALQRLERAGLVASRWDETASRRRRVYQLTDDGRRARAAKKQQWRGFVVGVQAVIGPMTAAVVR
jgi:DNA-binding PadR family transcriptional regulator